MAADIELNETTPLIGGDHLNGGSNGEEEGLSESSSRQELYDFLEAKTYTGQLYEYFIMILIVINVIAFVIGSLFVEEYNKEPWAQRNGGICGKLCDALWFGNYRDK